MISARIGQSGQTLQFSENVLRHFERYRQTRFWHREAGGLLFARIVDDRIIIEEATGPRRTDRRSWYSYQGDRRAEQREIDERFGRGLDYVGDWHTHPERRPRPSGADDRAMVVRFTESRHQLLAFAFVIVGTDPFPTGLAVAVHDGRSRTDLEVRSQSPPFCPANLD
jgi:integrative and conjugative element protein (TIGR02256 family)